MAKAKKFYALTADARLNLIIALTTYLTAHSSATITELASHFDVAEDEIRRAVTAMYSATVADSNEQWAMAINDDWSTDAVVELDSQLILDGNPRISARQAGALAAGLTVLLASASNEDRADIEALIQILSEGSIQAGVATVAIMPGTIDADLAKMRQAINAQKRVRFEYLNSKNEKTEREFDPIRLESNDQVWHVRGYCHLREEERSFRLDRMRASQVLDEPWSKAAFAIELSENIYEANDSDTKVVLEVSPEAYDLIGNFNAKVLAESGAHQELKRIEISVGYLPSLGKLISVYGGAARVVSPQAARDIVRDYALQALGQKPLAEDKD